MCEKQDKLAQRATKWFAAANQLLKGHGAPEIGTPENHMTWFEETESGHCMMVNVGNFVVLCFNIDRAQPMMNPYMSVSRDETVMSRHKLAVLVNVLTQVKVSHATAIRIGLPFEIIDGMIECVDNLE